MKKMRRFEVGFKILTEIRSLARGSENKRIKRLLGDSDRNNRTLTVNQTIRFLNLVGLTAAAETIKISNNLLENEILNRRSNRTDAIDLTELVNTYRIVVMNGRNNTYRRKIGNALAKVG